MNWAKLGNITLLVAEDDKFNRLLIRSILAKNSQIKIIEAENGEEALRVLNANAMDAILLDIHMPKMNGFETLKAIRQDKIYHDLPVIVITSDDIEKKRSLSMGANDFIPKPFKLNELESKVYKLLVEQ